MGDIYLSQYAATGCPELSARALRVLLRMALACYDEPTEPGADNEGLYYGGWKGLTVVLGYGVVMDDDPLPKRMENQIDRALRELKRAGYVTVAPRRMQRAHWHRVYRLSLAPISRAVDTPQRV
jgi:hypothetical protein